MAFPPRSISFPFRGALPSTAELIAANLIRERSSRVVPLERAAQATRGTIAALEGLRAPVEEVRQAARALGVDSGVTTGVTSSDTSVAVGIGTDEASPGNYDLTVTSVARGSSFSFVGAENPFTSLESRVVSKIDDSLPEKARTITFTFGTDDAQESVAIEITASTTIGNFIADFNATSSRAAAEAINIGTEATPNYSVVVRSTATGTTRGSLAVEIGESLLDPNSDGDSSDAPFTSAVSAPAQNARFSIGGIAGTFERESNTVTDAIGGVTLLLNGIGETALAVSADTGAATSRARTLVTTLNRLNDFIDSRNGLERAPLNLGGGITPGPLRTTRVDDLLREGLKSDLRGLSSVGSGALSLPELGITTARSGRLEFDEATFRNGVLNAPKEATASLKALGLRIETTVETFDGSNGLIEVARMRARSELDRYESSIAAVEQRLSERTAVLTELYSRMEGTVARLSSQRAVLATLFPRER